MQAYEALLQSPQTQCATIPAEGRTLDDDEGCVEYSGPAQYWRREPIEGAEGGRLHWTNAHSGANAANVARFELVFETAGTYRVEALMVSPRNVSTRVPYHIHHGGNDVDLVIDQSASPGWRELGEWAFREGGSQWLTISDNSGEHGSDLHIGVDAIRVTPVTP